MDILDEVLAKIVANKVDYIAGAQEKRGTACRAGMKNGASFWAQSGKLYCQQ
jgi:hypothetical protein